MTIRSNALAAAAAVFLSAVSATPASASLIGATVDVTANYPDPTSVYTDPGSVIVGNGVEYPTGSYPTYNSNFSVDILANSLVISMTSGVSFGSADFNGFVLSVLSGPDITSAFVDASSNLSPIELFISGGDLYVDFAGLNYGSPWSTTINFTTSNNPAVPEPATWAMMLIGFGAAGYSLRRRRAAMIAQIA